MDLLHLQYTVLDGNSGNSTFPDVFMRKACLSSTQSSFTEKIRKENSAKKGKKGGFVKTSFCVFGENAFFGYKSFLFPSFNTLLVWTMAI